MHAYALIHQPIDATAMPKGVMGSLQLWGQDGLFAVVEPKLQIDDVQKDNETLLNAVLTHDRVICELFQKTTVLPLRFNSFLPPEALLTDLTVNRQHYLSCLDQLDGKAEYTVKLIPIPFKEEPISGEMKGKEYFLAKKQLNLAAQQWQEQQIFQLEQITQSFAEQYPIHVNLEMHQIYLLGDRCNLNKVTNILTQVQNANKCWQLSISEPLPPFHFVQ